MGRTSSKTIKMSAVMSNLKAGVRFLREYNVLRSDEEDCDALSDDPQLYQVYGYNERTGMFCIGSGSFVHQSDVTYYAISKQDGLLYIAHEELDVVYRKN